MLSSPMGAVDDCRPAANPGGKKWRRSNLEERRGEESANVRERYNKNRKTG